MKNLLAFLLAVPLLFCAQKGIELQFQEGREFEYHFSGYFPYRSEEEPAGKRVKVEGKVLLQINDVLEDGKAHLTATLSDFSIDTKTELGNQLVNMVLDSMMAGGKALWTLSPKGELIEFTSDAFFFTDYANQLLAMGLFSPLLRGAIEEGRSSMSHKTKNNQFVIEYAAEQVTDKGAVIAFHIDSSREVNGKPSELSAFLRANFDLTDGWAKEVYYDVHCEQMGVRSREDNHYTFAIHRK